eukprot:TRINITY_DN872_c0_g1_i1.p1 TRINITY_DN872_c0_g1~~TRINITY_DN872_c0_g1_i1.p1  ORF type:complete len:360 (+),score=87.87 TRINITY_DN872_c0_g1_i1:347-1426(+)
MVRESPVAMNLPAPSDVHSSTSGASEKSKKPKLLRVLTEKSLNFLKKDKNEAEEPKNVSAANVTPKKEENERIPEEPVATTEKSENKGKWYSVLTLKKKNKEGRSSRPLPAVPPTNSPPEKDIKSVFLRTTSEATLVRRPLPAIPPISPLTLSSHRSKEEAGLNESQPSEQVKVEIRPRSSENNASNDAEAVASLPSEEAVKHQKKIVQRSSSDIQFESNCIHCNSKLNVAAMLGRYCPVCAQPTSNNKLATTSSPNSVQIASPFGKKLSQTYTVETKTEYQLTKSSSAKLVYSVEFRGSVPDSEQKSENLATESKEKREGSTRISSSSSSADEDYFFADGEPTDESKDQSHVREVVQV